MAQFLHLKCLYLSVFFPVTHWEWLNGQMISIGLNIPGIYLSTQDKVRDFSVNNGFKNYDVDIREPNWFETLKLKRKLLTEKDSTYLKEWYEIRDKFIADCHTIDKNWIEKNFKL